MHLPATSMLKGSSLLLTTFKKTVVNSTRLKTYGRRIAASGENQQTASVAGNMSDFVDQTEELDNARGEGRRGASNRGGRGGRGGRGEMSREVTISKALSRLLRHAAVEAGLTLDGEGFARVDQVMKWQRLKSIHVTFEDIRTAVSDNAKQRFSMKLNQAKNPTPDPNSSEPSDWMIRANQGHSIAIDSAALLVPITLESGNVPEIVVHGTYYAFYQPIVDSGGVKKMGRNHIHFSTGLPEDKQGVISGMRNDAEILIYVDIKKSLKDGQILWWLSENGVVLTEGDATGLLPTKYWTKVEGRKQDVGILWQDGEKIADLPEHLKSRKAPLGKGHKGRGGCGAGRGRGRGKGHHVSMADDEYPRTKE